MKVNNSTIKFRIDVDFEGAEVDMALKEAFASGVQTPYTFATLIAAKLQGVEVPPIPIDEDKLPDTPTSYSVLFCLNWLAGFVDRNEMEIIDHKWVDYSKPRPEGSLRWETKTELEELGIDVTDWYGLMQGTCHLNCEVPLEMFSQELVDKANQVVQAVFAKFIVYFK